MDIKYNLLSNYTTLKLVKNRNMLQLQIKYTPVSLIRTMQLQIKYCHYISDNTVNLEINILCIPLDTYCHELLIGTS